MSQDWTTDAERSQYRRSPDFAATLAYLERLVAAAPQLSLQRFGTSPEGRDLLLVVAASGGEFTPAAAQASGKAIVLLEAGIHSGEIEGKDAGLALLRDLTVADKLGGLLDHVVLMFLPVFNVDGHARASPWLRINQNGPELRGTRGTGQHINLNRDFVKADAPEMRAWLAMFEAWMPDLFIDIHATNGADYQYDLTWLLEEWDSLHPAPRAWQREALIGRAFPATEQRGHLLAPYMELVDHRDIAKGLVNFGSGPRYSTGYTAIRNRPGLLVETHMLKDYATRVKGTYDLVVEVLREVNARPEPLRAAVRAADADTIARAGRADARVALQLTPTRTPEDFTLNGYAYSHTASEISGDRWVHYQPDQPRTLQVPFYRALEVAQSVQPPAGYAILPAWREMVMPRLAAHGITGSVLARAQTVQVERYRLSDPRWATRPFEGRVRIDDVTIRPERLALELPAGTQVVPLRQRGANVAVHLLEPAGPDSLLRWGFFDIVFEIREYADARVGEALARDMLRENPALKAEFEARLAHDAAFAADPAARLNFFFERSRWADPELGHYPVLRLDAAALAALLP